MLKLKITYCNLLCDTQKTYRVSQKKSRGKKWDVCARNSEIKQILENIYKRDLQIILKPI
jgi:hypothetical protein